MEISFQEDEFDARQNALVGRIVQDIHEVLADSDHVPADVLASLTGSIAFAVCSILDGKRVTPLRGGGSLVPFLAFDRNGDRQHIIALLDQPWMHEYVHGWVSELYEPAIEVTASRQQAPCPYCQKPLRTPAAKQCRFCRMDWHDPKHVFQRR